MLNTRTLCALVGLSSAFLVAAPALAQHPIRIGATMSETGPYTTQGIPAKNGYVLCEKHVNAKGGVLGREVAFLIYDDKSDGKGAAALYEKLIVEDKVDAIMGPYGSLMTEAVAPVTEKHKKVMLTPLAATTSIWEQGRRYIFMQLPPSEFFLAGLIDMAARNGLKTVALVTEDTLFPKSAAKGTIEFSKQKGMDVVLHEEFAKGTKDFIPILQKIRAINADVIGIASANLSDYIQFTKQLKEQEINVKMFGTGGAVAEFQKELGKAADFSYGLSAWEPTLPNPGIKEFVEDYKKQFNAEPSFHAAGAYAGCQLFIEAARRANSLDSEKLREELLKLKKKTIFADYAVDERGYQTANKGVFVQWQDGKKVVVWPDQLTSAKPRFPTPPWSQR